MAECDLWQPRDWIDRDRSWQPNPRLAPCGSVQLPAPMLAEIIRSEAYLANEHIERWLAAVLAADVAGYSRLMGSDEVGTLAALKGHRGAPHVLLCPATVET
jgi:hypothetical protein